MKEKGLVLLGRVSGPHGIKGELKIRPYSGEPESLLGWSSLLLAVGENAEPKAWKVEQSRAHKSWTLVKLEGCSDRSSAELLQRADVYIHEDELPELEDGEFYLRDLEGKTVKTEDGQIVGVITGLLTGGVQDILQVENNGQEHLIPLVSEFVVSVNEDAVIMALPSGLLEINA
ncbi:ribosome maturation factor RimM [Candidatus Electronema sp. JM]|uniref:ribosome maturation factor RimM n=1 Tax=Candidatus Electronema sp. JM TaxID=3401571 RepID=UPI003AA8189A